MSRCQLRLKLHCAAWQERDLTPSLLASGQRWSTEDFLMTTGGSVFHLDRSSSPDLNVRVEVRTRRKPIGTDTHARIGDLEQLNRLTSPNLDRNLDVR